MTTKVMLLLSTFSMISDLERDFISTRTKDTLIPQMWFNSKVDFRPLQHITFDPIKLVEETPNNITLNKDLLKFERLKRVTDW